MKKSIFLIVIFSLFLVGCNSKENNVVESKKAKEFYLLKHEAYKDFEVDDIINYEVIRYTVAGDNKEEFSDRESIEKAYKGLSETKLGEETNMACEDNTTVFIFYLKDGTTRSFEKECDWFIIDGKRYMIVN